MMTPTSLTPVPRVLREIKFNECCTCGQFILEINMKIGAISLNVTRLVGFYSRVY